MKKIMFGIMICLVIVMSGVVYADADNPKLNVGDWITPTDDKFGSGKDYEVLEVNKEDGTYTLILINAGTGEPFSNSEPIIQMINNIDDEENTYYLPKDKINPIRMKDYVPSEPSQLPQPDDKPQREFGSTFPGQITPTGVGSEGYLEPEFEEVKPVGYGTGADFEESQEEVIIEDQEEPTACSAFGMTNFCSSFTAVNNLIGGITDDVMFNTANFDGAMWTVDANGQLCAMKSFLGIPYPAYADGTTMPIVISDGFNCNEVMITFNDGCAFTGANQGDAISLVPGTCPNQLDIAANIYADVTDTPDISSIHARDLWNVCMAVYNSEKYCGPKP